MMQLKSCIKQYRTSIWTSARVLISNSGQRSGSDPISSSYSPALPQRACAVILRSKEVVSRAVSAEPRRDPAPLPHRFSSDRNDSMRSDRSVSLSAPGIFTGVSVKRWFRPSFSLFFWQLKHSRNQTQTSSGSWMRLFFCYLTAIRTVL